MNESLIIYGIDFEIHFKNIVDKLTFERIKEWLDKDYSNPFSVGMVYLDKIDYLKRTLQIIKEISEYEKNLVEYDWLIYDYNISGINETVLEIKSLNCSSVDTYDVLPWVSNNSDKKLYILDNERYRKYKNLKFPIRSTVVLIT